MMAKEADQAGFVEFRYDRSDALQVFLVASFNGWNPRANPMHREGPAGWVCRVQLPAGAYQFHYLAEVVPDSTRRTQAASRVQWSCSNLEFLVVTPRGGCVETGPAVSSEAVEISCETQATNEDVEQGPLPLSRLEEALIRCFRRLPDHESRSAFLDVLQESVYC
jgi:hypothetical protein